MKNLLFLFGCVFCFQCTSNKEGGEKFVFPQEETIVMTKIESPDIIGAGWQLIKHDNYLIINDYMGDSIIPLFDLQSNTVKMKLFARGQGPSEFLGPLDIQMLGTSLIVNDRQTKKLTAVSMNEALNNSIKVEKIGQLPEAADIFLPLSKSKFVFVDMLLDKRYGLINTSEQGVIKEFQDYPDYWKEEKNIPPYVKGQFHQPRFLKHPSKPLFFSCSAYLFEIFSYEPESTSVPELVFQKQLGKYNYTYTDKPIVTTTWSKESDPLIYDIACTESHIYLLLGVKSNRWEILIIDWLGKPVKKLKTEKYVNCFTIDEEDKKGYCIISDPEATLAWFDIPD